MNRDFKSILRGHSFLTAACVVLQGGQGELRTAGAGHPPVLIARKDGQIESLASTAPPVGLLDLGRLELQSAFLNEGDSALLLTDGLYAVANSEGEHFSFERLVAALAGRSTTNPEELIEAAMKQVAAFAEGQPFDDDLALIAMRRKA